VTRSRVLWSVVAVVLVVIGLWIARNTSWDDVSIPVPPQGEARTNPFYAVQHFASALGARSIRDRTFVVPPADGVLVLSGWHWSLARNRRQAIERWVESGGRLVVDSLLVTTNRDFESWSGLDRKYIDDQRTLDALMRNRNLCRALTQEAADGSSTSDARTRLTVCGTRFMLSFTTSKPILWALRDQTRIQAVRVRVGQGYVTWINALPFRYQQLFDGDHGLLFVSATDLRRGDEVHFLSEDDMPQLLILVWRWGAPLVVLALLIVAMLIWRSAVRVGPLVGTEAAERRSLAEQIRGTGYFALHHGGADALHGAAVRALEEAARRRVPGYSALSASERGEALQRISGMNGAEVLSAVYHPRSQRSNQLRASIAIIETARRHILEKLTRSAYGTH
jgi:hypothetical protein